MSEEVFLTPEERLSQLGDTLLSSVLQNTDLCKLNRSILFGQLTPKVFKNENYIIYKVLYNFRDKGITPDEDFLKMYLMRNENLLLSAKEYIDIQAFSDLDENPVVGYTMAVLKQFVRLKGLEIEDHDAFKLTMEKYKIEYKNIELGTIYNKSKVILFDGLQVGNKYYQGYEDSVSFTKRGIAEIDSILDPTTGAGFIDASIAGLQDNEEESPIKIGDFGNILELNKHFGGIYTSLFYSVLAPTKGGKSKFTSRLFHNICVENGNNIVVWAHEGGWQAWLAQLRAIHFDWLYNRNENDPSKFKMGISQNVILSKSYPNEAIRTLEEASRIDLFSNPTYGNIHLIERPFKVETFIDEIETAVQTNGTKAVLIDYLQLISADSKNMSKPQVIGKAYQDLLAYAKKRNIAVISPAQFNQEFINQMSKSKDGGNNEVRTAGGESSEIIRTPDVNIALYADTNDLLNHEMKILSVPSRMASPFQTFPIYVDLGVCQFASLDPDTE